MQNYTMTVYDGITDDCTDKRMKKGIIYIHGKGGNAEEAAHYKPLFPEYDVIGFDYKSKTPWDAEREFVKFYDSFCKEYRSVSIIANSIGAYFALSAFGDKKIESTYFISPIVNMEKLISDMLLWANATEEDLKKRGVIETDFGETLSWEYLSYVKRQRLSWKKPTKILYGSKDNLQSIDTIRSFADKTGAELTVMKGGEHWFHTAEQTKFLDSWITE